MEYSSEFVSNEYMHLNHGGVQYWDNKDNFIVRPQGRADYHILYIFRGVCYTEIHNNPVTVNEGHMILFKPYEKQKYKFYKKDSTISCYIHFTGTGCEKLLNDIGFEKKRIINIGKSNTIFSLFNKMEKEFNLNRPFCDVLCSSYICEILSLAGRKNIYADDKVLLKNKKEIDGVCQFMYDNLSSHLTVEILAKKCNLSQGRFAHMFKEATGKTPIEYLTSIRISAAKELLLTFNYPVSEIAEMVGFPNQNYFARVFKKYTGMSPKQYQRKE